MPVKVLDPFDLAPKEAVRFFKGKDGVFMPTRTYRDLVGEAHAHAFAVAGAMRMDMLRDFYDAVQRGIAEGTTLREFQKAFDGIVSKYGWDYTGSRAWRSQVIFENNMNTAYSAGRWKQMNDPDVLAERPIWQYRIGFAIHHRPPHEALNGFVARADDPFWLTAWPPNGYGCHCWMRALTKEEAAAYPELTHQQKSLWQADPGWSHNVGASWEEGFADVMRRKIADTPNDLVQSFLAYIPKELAKLMEGAQP